MLTVLDLAFAGKQEVTAGGAAGGGGGGKDDVLSTPTQDKDVSVALDRLHSEGGAGSHLLRSLISQLTSRGKQRSSPQSSSSASQHVHGRTFSVTSLISPHVTAKAAGGGGGGGGEAAGGGYGASIGTDVMMEERKRKEGVEIKCQQCGWQVHILHCYSCGRKVSLTATPAAAGLNGTGNGLSPDSAASTAATTAATTPTAAPPSAAALPPLPASAAPSAASSHSPSSHSTLTPHCSTCGVLFLSGHLRYCVQCGWDMQRTGQKIEPPLVKSLSWQRKQARGHSIEGWLMKVGKTLRTIVTRWYVIRDSFLYTYGKQTDLRPSHVLFLEGCFVEAVSHEERSAKCRYGLEIILNEEQHKSRFLYCASAAQRQQWMEAIRYHANVHSVEEYYDIREELGVGRFSSVRMAISKQSGKQYACKIIDKSDIDEKEREAMRTEIAVLKLLNHPHIIKCKNVFENRRQMFIVMTFVRGGDLFDRIVKRRRFPERVAQRVMYDLLSVVSYLHLRGIVHNDLKPENIMMASEDDDSEIIIGDFGLSKFAMDQERFTMAQGTLAYVSPEVLKGTGYGKEVDLWSCGVILYLLVSGQLPFDSQDREQIIEKTCEGRIPFERRCFADISEECRALIRGLLTVDVERRLTCQQALSHPWFRLRWNEQGERIRDVESAAATASSSASISSSSAPSSPGLPPLTVGSRHASDTLASNPTPQLMPPPHLFFSNSSTAAHEGESSNEGGETGEVEEEEDDVDSESKDDVVDGAQGAGGAFRSRFINMADDDAFGTLPPDLSPSHSR